MFDFKKIDKKWQKNWETAKVFKAKENNKKKKAYVLEMYPYPSNMGLHMGHAFNYTIGDIYARFMRMKGFNVLYPMGYDSFGLPAENAAMKANSHPKIFTESAIKNFINQQKQLGLSYDWDRMLYSHDPNYYRWNQYFFLKFYEKGLVYRKKSPVNFCEKCNTVLANEQVHNGKCWRHEDTEVKIKHLEQWFIKTTEYSEELLKEINNLDWPERIKTMQENWIGKSYGTEIKFKINDEAWNIFTTRPDTIYGVTFMVVSAQHPRLNELVKKENKKKVEAFLKKIKSTSEKDAEELEKEGAFTGSYAINPLTNEKVPIYAGNFVVADYGSGMVMAVPAHDQRDFLFAKKYNIPIKIVIQSENKVLTNLNEAYVKKGILVNSQEFDNLENEKAKLLITKKLESKKLGKKTVNYKLRDWLVSRQRYWGTPIPIIYCDKCGLVPVKEKDLPVLLPEKVIFGKGNPLVTNKEFVNVKCPKCKSQAKRETDTMDTFFDSSWYYLRFIDNKNNKQPFDTKKANYWMPVDKYIGGAEHACMHLIYARFFTKALRDLKFLKIDEPFKSLFNQGMIHGEDGFVMSKSRGNIINPLEMIEKYGADTVRLFLVSIASPNKDFSWSNEGIESMFKFVNKMYSCLEKIKIKTSTKKAESKINKAIKEITEDIQIFSYNLAIIKIRALFVFLTSQSSLSKKDFESVIKIIAPFTPHLCEELWNKKGNKTFISVAKWPVFDSKKINLSLEFEDTLVETIRQDITSIIKLTNIKPEQITLFTSPKWKYKLYSKLKIEIKKTMDPKILIKKLMVEEKEKEISRLMLDIVKNPQKIPPFILKNEKQILENNKKQLEKEFNAKIIVVEADKSIELKAQNAYPSKPSIVLR